MVLNIVSFLYGYCEFCAVGNFPERFLNLAARTDLGIWDIRRIDGGISAKIIAKRYKKLIPLARKCGVRLRIIRKKGLPFQLIPYRKRAGMPLGFVLFCGIIFLLSQFYWIVELPQVSPSLQGKLESAIYDAGIRPGVLRSQVDGSMIADELVYELDELSWAGVITSGCYISVDARETGKAAQEVASSEPCNVIASHDGTIISINALEGQSVVSVGQSVAKGDLLISGVMEYSTGDVSMVHANGKVLAETFYQFTSEVSYELHRTERTGRVVTIRRLMLLGMEIPLYFSSNPDGQFEREYEEWQLSVAGTDFPLATRTERWYELRTVNRTIDADEAEAIAREDMSRQLKALDGLEIIFQSESLEHTDTGITLTVSVTAMEDISSQELILFE